MYGGTSSWLPSGTIGAGLSPRVRGNPFLSYCTPFGSGSIPACTGEPMPVKGVSDVARVYPRVYGGTGIGVCDKSAHAGLSPRVRGNPCSLYRMAEYRGSIPACTGEPPGNPAPVLQTRVYPRVYGGTVQGEQIALDRTGLSPRVRGNPITKFLVAGIVGSIPACTGEPTMTWRSSTRVRVYPRVYGGTFGCFPAQG